MKVSEAIRRKRAIRDFIDEPLPDEVVMAILKAGRRSQSSKNRQAWRFLAIRDRETLRQVSKLGQFAGHLAGAALGVLILTPPPDKFYGALFDAGQAAAYMQLAATELGVGSCLATLYDSDKVAALLGIPQDWQALMAISFGYPAQKEKLRLAKLLKGRKDFDEVVMWEKWS
ncbi:MAG: nitroreductase family protein [Anaerolineales bacterium]|nr:nitroreductase family protein [Anaerolineales bacterium]